MVTKKLISSREARTAKHQHRKPCSDCPWRRDALQGWLGGGSTAEWLAEAHGDNPVPCHVIHNQQCAGIAVYRANVCKKPRDPVALRLPADRDAVFATPTEFKDHHEVQVSGSGKG